MYKFLTALAVGALPVISASQVQAQSWSAPTYVNWTGFYIGGQGTYRWTDVDVDWGVDIPGVGTGANLSSDDWMGGVHGGVQQQFGNWVLGVDLSGDWGGSGESSNLEFDVFPFSASGSVSSEIDEIFTATARLGYAWSNFMIYAKGGYASADVTASGAVTTDIPFVCNAGCSVSRDQSFDGWTVGGGFAWMFAQNISLGLDYSFIDVGDETFRFDVGSEEVAVNVNPDNIQTLSARLTFHFNGPRETAPYVPIK